jgi:hypothetical protein
MEGSPMRMSPVGKLSVMRARMMKERGGREEEED